MILKSNNGKSDKHKQAIHLIVSMTATDESSETSGKSSKTLYWRINFEIEKVIFSIKTYLSSSIV